MHPWDDDGNPFSGASGASGAGKHWGRGRGRSAWSGSRGDPWTEMWNGWWRGPAQRCERGQVRYLVLDALKSQPRHGYEIIQAIADKSRGAYKPSPGVIYPTLQLLEELGHARTTAQGERKTYEITDEGRRELKDHEGDVAEFYEESAGTTAWEAHADDVAHIMKKLGRVVWLFKMSMRRGEVRPSTMRKIRSILDDALSKLEELLAPEDG
jgi:DNA-binding PadR family transcriptional regulator